VTFFTLPKPVDIMIGGINTFSSQVVIAEIAVKKLLIYMLARFKASPKGFLLLFLENQSIFELS